MDFSMAFSHSEEKLNVETNLDKFQINGFKEKINYYYYKSNRDMITKINAAGRVFFNILRYELEKVELQDMVKQFSLITKFALQKLLADKVYFISYNNYEESIQIECCKCNSMLNSNPDIEENVRGGVKYILSENLIMQKIFECIHRNEIITKDQIEGNLNVENCFVLSDESADMNQDKTFNDILLVPVISHNRKIGVLIALSFGKHHFNKIDRLLMADFVHNAGIEIFESKLFRAIQNINQTRQNIYDNIVKEVLELFNAKEVVLLQNDVDGSTKKVLSFRGNKHAYIFQKNAQIPLIDLNKVTELKDDVHSFSENGNQGISIPLKDRKGGIYAYIILYDDNDDGFSKSLYRECSLLSQEISHVIWDTELSNKQKQIMKSLIAHDVSSSLRGIDGARKNILYSHYAIRDFLTNEMRLDGKLENALNKFRLATKDMERFTGVGKHLIDYFTENLIDNIDVQIDDWQTFGIRKYTDIYKNKMDESRKADLNQIVNQVLHSLTTEFKEKNIKFSPPTGSWPSKLWIDSNLAKQIIDNMVSNTLKYSLSGTVFRVKMELSITGYRLIMENEGSSLTSLQENEIDTIFDNGVRFSDFSEGKGIGLFFAKNILLQHGGDITVSYKKINENRGLYTFTLIFPFQLELRINPFK
jgi:signal transduction histidine kinase